MAVHQRQCADNRRRHRAFEKHRPRSTRAFAAPTINRDDNRSRHCHSAPSSSPSLALPIDSDPTAHSAFVLQIRLTEFRGEISLFAKDDAVMKDQRERDDKEQRNPVIYKSRVRSALNKEPRTSDYE